MVPILDGPSHVSFRAGQPAGLHHRDSPAECDGCAAHGTHAQQHHPGRAHTQGAYARIQRRVGARHRPRLHRHRSQGGEHAQRAGHRQEGPHPRAVLGTCLEVERETRRHHPPATPQVRCFLRLGTHQVHDGRRFVRSRD